MTADDTQNLAPGPQALDEKILLRLLTLAGPGDAPELMRRLIADLSDVAAGLKVGLATDDRTLTRKHSHVLMAIAGTLGAQQLYQSAQRLNQCAKDDMRALEERFSATLMPQLQGQIAQLCALSAELGLSV